MTWIMIVISTVRTLYKLYNRRFNRILEVIVVDPQLQLDEPLASGVQSKCRRKSWNVIDKLTYWHGRKRSNLIKAPKISNDSRHLKTTLCHCWSKWPLKSLRKQSSDMNTLSCNFPSEVCKNTLIHSWWQYFSSREWRCNLSCLRNAKSCQKTREWRTRSSS